MGIFAVEYLPGDFLTGYLFIFFVYQVHIVDFVSSRYFDRKLFERDILTGDFLPFDFFPSWVFCPLLDFSGTVCPGFLPEDLSEYRGFYDGG